jgi:hypothetical protein
MVLMFWAAKKVMMSSYEVKKASVPCSVSQRRTLRMKVATWAIAQYELKQLVVKSNAGVQYAQKKIAVWWTSHGKQFGRYDVPGVAGSPRCKCGQHGRRKGSLSLPNMWFCFGIYLLVLGNHQAAAMEEDRGMGIMGRLPAFTGKTDDFVMWMAKFLAVTTMGRIYAVYMKTLSNYGNESANNNHNDDDASDDGAATAVDNDNNNEVEEEDQDDFVDCVQDEEEVMECSLGQVDGHLLSRQEEIGQVGASPGGDFVRNLEDHGQVSVDKKEQERFVKRKRDDNVEFIVDGHLFLHEAELFTKNCDTATFDEHVRAFCTDENYNG